jgi:hypothetical protein
MGGILARYPLDLNFLAISAPSKLRGHAAAQ